MTVKTEGQHKGEFVASPLVSISFDKGTLASGHVVKDGTPLVKSGNNVIPSTGAVASDGSLDETFAGLAYGNYDSTGGAIPVAMVARLAEVDSRLLHYPEVSDQAGADAALDAALAAKFIIKR
jgi:hypothetical protein